AYLLWHGELPTEKELDALRQQMAAARKLNKSARGTLLAMDAAIDPMDVLRTVVSAQGASKALTKPSLEEAVAMTALFPTIVGAAYRRREGKEPVEPRADLGHAANLLWMMEGKEPDLQKVHLVDSYLVLLADHGLNASTFAARVVASTGSDLTSCVVGAIAALKGPAHGGATFAARTMLDKIGSADNAEKWLTEAHARHERFSGFGHRVYRTYDPRAKILREMAKTAAPDLHRTAARTEEIALKILHDAHPERPNATNVDFWASVVLTGAGIPKEMSFEEVAYLLWHGNLPTRSELDGLALELAGSRQLTEATSRALAALPPDTDPMDVLRSCVSVQGVEHRLSRPTVPLAIHATA